MRGKTTVTLAVLWVIVFALFAPCQVLCGEKEGTVVGQVTETYQIVTDDGLVYEIAETETGEELLNHLGKTVEAVGMIVEFEGIRSIDVRSFIVIQE